MFYEVRIFNPQGNLKKIVSPRDLSKTYWNSFNKTQPSKLESLILLREYKKQMSASDRHSGNG